MNIQKELSVSYSVPAAGVLANTENLEKVHDSMVHAWKVRSYDTPFSFVYAPYDHATLARIEELAQEKKAFAYSQVLVIGIGGSSLGAHALTDVLLSEYSTMSVHYADTVDPVESRRLYVLLERCLQQGEQVLVVMVSKTGTTLESLAHFAVFIELLQRYRADSYQHFVVAVSTEASVLAIHARERGYSLLTVPEAIGGRYSVCTAVGLFVLAALGIDMQEVCRGARFYLDTHFSRSLEQSHAVKSALCIGEHYRCGRTVLDYFIFSKVCANIGSWFRQLVGEGLGKQNAAGDFCHIVPTVSIGSIDLHSVAQLYLGGRPPIFTQFLSVSSYDADFAISQPVLGPDLSHFTYGSLMHVLFEATQRAYDEIESPYIHIKVPALTPFYMGQLLQLHLLQVVYLGALLRVKQFDQPQVELYKKYVRELTSL